MLCTLLNQMDSECVALGSVRATLSVVGVAVE